MVACEDLPPHSGLVQLNDSSQSPKTAGRQLCAHCGCSGLSQADIRFPPRNKKADLRSRSAIYADCADSVQRLLPVVGVSFPASHFCKFCYDRDAAQSSKINICPHCFVTHNGLILSLQVEWILIFRQTAMSLRSRGLANGLSARSAEAPR